MRASEECTSALPVSAAETMWNALQIGRICFAVPSRKSIASAWRRRRKARALVGVSLAGLPVSQSLRDAVLELGRRDLADLVRDDPAARVEEVALGQAR